MPRASTLSASILLSQRELKHYRRYLQETQALSLPVRSDRLPLPSATRYADLQAWLQRRNSGYLSDTPLHDLVSSLRPDEAQVYEQGIASICKHKLHPAQRETGVVRKEVIERCPVCIVECHMQYISLLKRNLNTADSLVHQRWEPSPCDESKLQAYHAAKVTVTRELTRIEDLAALEADWEMRNSSACTDAARTASEALEIYWAGTEVSVASTSDSTASSDGTASKEGVARAVRFTGDTRFERGRNPLYFWRRSPRYEAGGKYSPETSDDDAEMILDACSPEDCKNGDTEIRLRSGNNKEVKDDDEDGLGKKEDDGEDNLDEEEKVTSDDGVSNREDNECESDSDSTFSECDYTISVEVEEETSFVVFADD